MARLSRGRVEEGFIFDSIFRCYDKLRREYPSAKGFNSYKMYGSVSESIRHTPLESWPAPLLVLFPSSARSPVDSSPPDHPSKN